MATKQRLSREDTRMPHVEAGMRVGLFGGTFNPPHEGHVLVAETALTRLCLDQIWWIVTPGNPLKDTHNLPPLAERIALSRKIMPHPAIKVTGFEARYKTRFTADLIDLVTIRNPDVDFVWVMGADNLTQFHRWQKWRQIANTVPLAIIDRPGSTTAYLSARAAIALRQNRIDESDAPRLASMVAPAWTFLHGPRSAQSSSAIRAHIDASARKM